jgi:putative membrane protein
MKTPLTKSELDRLAQVIAECEKKTSGEIRLMLVKRSSPVGHVLPTLWLSFVVVALLILWFMRSHFEFTPIWLIPSVLLGAVLLAAALARCPFFQRLLVTSRDLQHNVWVRAELEFHREGLNHTQGATGILLFLSLFERQAVVLADRGISSRLKESAWEDVVEKIVQGARSKRLAARLEEAIRLCGDHLAEHFPSQPGDVDELSNAVIVKD